ncbi:MAG: FtsX-like permease family protein, partial [Lachnospiraceae bacterium]
MFGTNRHNVFIVIKENIIYFVTLIICIALFYGFVSLGDIKNPLVQGNLEYDFEMYAPMIRYCIYAVSISIFILISYVNSHMFKEKLKEISILITLGMKRSKIAIWYSKDMLSISALSFVIGILFGIGCSYAVNAVISLITYGRVISNNFFYLYSFIETIVFFIIMYVGMTAINIIKVMHKKPLELLNNNKIP